MDNVQDSVVPKFIHRASFVSCMRHVRVTKFVLLNPMSCEYFGSSAEPTFGVTLLNDKVLASCSDSDAVLLLKVTSAYLSNTGRRVSFPVDLSTLRSIAMSRRCVRYPVQSGLQQ